MEKTAKDIFSLSEKILLYVGSNEPINSFSDLILKAGIEESKMKMNIERLHEAGLITGNLVKTLGQQHFVHVHNIKLSYSGVQELTRLINDKKLVSGFEINLGALKFNLNLAQWL